MLCWKVSACGLGVAVLGKLDKFATMCSKTCPYSSVKTGKKYTAISPTTPTMIDKPVLPLNHPNLNKKCMKRIDEIYGVSGHNSALVRLY